ncbi:hypothetical protein C8A03DRAFT_43594 [Achaetomium macrosporum]|uniref:SUN domain-containing protein n=1 Tax=Achaetomium macrosporum TaxID=79813 RepID=A0AAN7HCP4_9PEZI|nr:hypothetical protein C8A03DRAFT_43594 [Achaetomium macrosporum]
MADITNSSQQSSAGSQTLVAESQERADAVAAMIPPRRLRETASPSPSFSRGSTPVRDAVNGRLMPDRGSKVRTPIPAKYSTSYGSPITQLPDRSTVGGGGNVTKAAAEIFTKVKRDNLAAEARRRTKARTRAVGAGSRDTTASPPPPTIQPTIEVDNDHEEAAQSEGRNEAVDGMSEGSEYEDENEPPTGRAALRRSPRKAARKRPRDDEEAETLAEKERKERETRLRRERSAEARKRSNQKRAEAQAAAREKAEQERLAEQAREEAAKAAMPPPPQPPVPLPPPENTMTPASGLMPNNASTQRPGSARSFVEEGNVFRNAAVQTPPRPQSLLRPALRPAAAAPRQPAPAPAPAPPTSPPSVLKRPPRRPGGTTPRAPIELSPGTDDQQDTAHQSSVDRESPQSDDQQPPRQTSPSAQRAMPDFTSRLRQHLKPLPGRVDAGSEKDKLPPTAEAGNGHPHWSKAKDAFSLWSIFRIFLGAFLVLHAMRLAHTHARPDLYESPVLTFRWYGWKDWTSNVGQFFPSPLLHPLGVLTDAQYDDLKDYLQRRTTTTEAVVDNLKSILPKVVSVRKDKKGKVIIADEFWDALKDRIQKDNSILSLDRQSRISEKHWKAIEQRLKDAGLFVKPLSTGDVERIVQKSAPAAWDKWFQENKRKVAEMLRQTQGKSPVKESDETVISRKDFMRELMDQLARSKEHTNREMDSLRVELHGLIHEIKAKAKAGGMNKADIKALVKEIVDKEVTRRYLDSAAQGGASSIDADLRSRVNHFSPGNAAQIDLSLTSPTYKIAAPPVLSKEWLKSMPRRPQFIPDVSQSLTPWSDPGHCWCAATRGHENHTHPASLAVRFPSFVIPQYVVLEHIDPGATNDPLAMPRDVEVWAVFDEHARRERMLDWMAVQFPDDVGHALLEKGLAKIGKFTYEHRADDGGVFVHKLADELVDQLRAATDLVMVRAVTNYGSPDHTCFYRVRMYGEAVELGAEKESKKW